MVFQAEMITDAGSRLEEAMKDLGSSMEYDLDCLKINRVTAWMCVTNVDHKHTPIVGQWRMAFEGNTRRDKASSLR